MSFNFADTPIPIRTEIQEAMRKEWAFLAAPGTWWSGEERVQIAAEARRAMAKHSEEAAASHHAADAAVTEA